MTTVLKRTKKGRLLDVYSPTRSENHMQEWLGGRLIGQPDATSAAVRMKTLALSKLKDGLKAAGLYYLIGEPGVGKTHLVKLLAQFIHGNPRAYVKIDGGTMQEKHQANRLIGSPPGYVGYEEPDKAVLREAKEAEADAAAAEKDPEKAARKYRKNPRKLLSRQNLVASRCGSNVPLTILFVDEAEKLYETIDDLFLNAVEDGILPLGDNEEVEFGDVLVIYAGNPGTKEATNRKERIGFNHETAEDKEAATLEIIMEALKTRYRVEMLDRFDEFIYFKKLGKEDLRTITGLRVNDVIDRFMETMSRGTAFTIEVQKSARDFMLEEALKNSGNARRIGRAVRKYFMAPLNRLIAKAEDNENDLLVTADDKVVVSHDPAYEGGKLLKFELFEDEGVRAPQDTLPPETRTTPLGQKFTHLDRKLTAAAAAAKAEPKSIYAVAIQADSELEAFQELKAAREEASTILRMDFVEAKMRMHAPWGVVLYYSVTEKQAELLREHNPLAEVTYVGKSTEISEESDTPAPGGATKSRK